MGRFKIKEITQLDNCKLGDTFEESDYVTSTPSGKFIQMEYVDEDHKKEPYKVKPGIWLIERTQVGMALSETSFINDRILDSFVNTKTVTDKIDCFFNKFDVYKELGFDIPKRTMLLYGPAGSGKSTIITEVVNKYIKDNKTAVFIWRTDKIEPSEVKSFFKTFEYIGIDKAILVAEDIGGVEAEEARMHSDPSLLALLDNQEKTFTIPIFIVATTNYPTMFIENLANRPNRIDDKVEVGFPDAKSRVDLLKFFIKSTELDINLENKLKSKDCETFTPAHLREVVIRSRLYDKTMLEVINDLSSEIRQFKRGFSKSTDLGLGL
jgi:energy-coupling factor transporter ATP-binding protein EcfA2